jgi:hypothetical protein
MAINLFSTSGILDRGNEAFKQGYDQMGAMRTDRTNMQAGRAYAGGDRQGAARMLAQGGNINDARTLENDIQGDERQLMQDQQAAEQQTYQRGRDKTTDQAAQAERNYTTLKRITGGLRGYDEGQRLPQLQRVLPIFEQLGLPVDQFAALTEDQLNNAGLDMFEGELDKQWQGMNLGGGGVGALNLRTGQLEVRREPDPKMVSVAGGATLTRDGQPVYTAPKAFAPPRAGSGGSGGNGGGGDGYADLPPGATVVR